MPLNVKLIVSPSSAESPVRSVTSVAERLSSERVNVSLPTINPV